MSAAEPAALRRHRLRPFWWLGITLALLVVAEIPSFQDLDGDRRHRSEWPRVEGLADSDYVSGRHEVLVWYLHPVTQQTVGSRVVIVNGSKLPQPGGPITIAADPNNPDRIVVPGDDDDTRDPILAGILVLGTVLLAAVTRWVAVGRTRRLVTRSRPSFAMLAALSLDGYLGRQVRCSLYPLDAGHGTPPVCSFLTLTTGGLPVDGPAFPVEVRGRPVPGGLLIVRAGEQLLWPLRRPLGRSGPSRPDIVVAAPARPSPAETPPSHERSVAPLAVCIGPVAGFLLLATIVVSAIVPFRVVRGTREVDDLRANGRPVIATVVSGAGSDLIVTYDAGQDLGIVRARTDGSRHRNLERRYPAHADPDDPETVRLDADPYDWRTPAVVVAVLWGTVAVVGWPRVRWWRDARRAARGGLWHDVVLTTRDGNVFISCPDTSGFAAAARGTRMTPLAVPEPAVAAGSFDPGEGVAISGTCLGRGPAYVPSRPRSWFGRLRGASPD